jgi:thiol-disulfide isomerase/thioredoxin
MPMKLLKFTARWCGPCSSLNDVFKKTQLPENIIVEEVDLDETDPNFISIMNVRSVPTMILLDENDKEIKRRIGSASQQQLLEWLNING